MNGKSCCCTQPPVEDTYSNFSSFCDVNTVMYPCDVVNAGLRRHFSHPLM